MDVEESPSLPPRKFRLSTDEVIEIPGFVLEHLHTLTTMIVDFPVEEDAAIQLLDFVKKPVLEWIISAYTITHIETEPITKFDQLYKHAEAYNRLIRTLNPLAPPLLTLFGSGVLPSKENLPLLFDLIKVLNWLDAEAMLLLSLVKVYQILSTMAYEEIEALFTLKKRKLEGDDKGLPFTPFYRREKLISAFLSQELPHDLIRAPLALKKHITPFSSTNDYTLFLKADGLYENQSRSTEDGKLVRVEIPGTPLLIASGFKHSFCLTSTGLYGRGVNTNGQLGLGSVFQASRWKKIGIDGEVLLISAGSYFSLVLTTTGLYSCGMNDDGQLGLGNYSDGEGRNIQFFTRIEAIDGDVRHIEAGDHTTFVLTTNGLYACGVNDENELGVDPTKSSVYVLTPVLNLEGTILSISSGEEMSGVVTTEGLYVTGANEHGQLGLTEPGGTMGFTKVDTAKADPLQVFCGYHYTILWTKDGLYGTGINRWGQLATGDTKSRNVFTKMRGLQGEIQAVLADDESVLVLTTVGVFLAGRDQGIGYRISIEVDETIEQLSVLVFSLLDLNMGYSFLPTLSITSGGGDDDEEPQRKKQRLQCMKCQGKAQFIASYMQNTAYCSRYCLLSHKFSL